LNGYGGTDLRGIVLRGLPLARLHAGVTAQEQFVASAAQADLAAARFDGADLSGAHLEGATLFGARLERVIAIGTHFDQALLAHATLERAFLGQAHLESAILIQGRLQQAFLRQAYLEGADLREAHLEGADGTGSDHSVADVAAQAITAVGGVAIPCSTVPSAMDAGAPTTTSYLEANASRK
jgi:uncharacterized protein YjbI with pentapeptide repeats